MNKFEVFINKNANGKSAQYITSKQKEFARLLKKDLFKVVTTDSISSNAQIFHSCFVDEIRNPGTDKAYEKSWLIIQAYNNKEKHFILIQSPIIERVSQRLIVCLAAMFQDNDNIKLYL